MVLLLFFRSVRRAGLRGRQPRGFSRSSLGRRLALCPFPSTAMARAMFLSSNFSLRPCDRSSAEKKKRNLCLSALRKQRLARATDQSATIKSLKLQNLHWCNRWESPVIGELTSSKSQRQGHGPVVLTDTAPTSLHTAPSSG